VCAARTNDSVIPGERAKRAPGLLHIVHLLRSGHGASAHQHLGNLASHGFNGWEPGRVAQGDFHDIHPSFKQGMGQR